MESLFSHVFTLLVEESGSFRPLSRSPLSRFAHFPFRPESFRPRVVSPTFPFAPESFRPLPRSPLSRFAPLWNFISNIIISAFKVVKSFDFLAYWWFFVITYKRWKKQNKKKLSILCGILKSNPAVFVCQPQSWFILSILRPCISHELLWHRKSVFYIVRILSICYFCHFLWTHGHFNFLDTYGISMFSFPRNSSTIKFSLGGID